MWYVIPTNLVCVLLSTVIPTSPFNLIQLFFILVLFLSLLLHTVEFSYDMKRGMYINYNTIHLIASLHTVTCSTYYHDITNNFFYFRVKIGKYNSSIIINYYDSSIVGMIVKWLTWDAMACFSGCWRKVCACIVHQYQHKKFNGTQSVYSWHTPVSNKG